ncbi:MAG: carboxypeptidase-like regulatory domain-containing protein, partial [Bacteroidota bacterium]|nr:carboxypeptidase-like regulatory domain-containing protein [Bacteroidota bacterium]
MKLTLTLILFAVLAATAGSTYSQSARINLKMQDASLVDVFREIERTSEFGFFFKSEEIDLSRRVSIDLKNVSIEEVLKKILMDTYDYRILDKNIVVTRGNFSTTVVQQGKLVSGKVTDSSGASLPGVSVVVKGTTNGTITDGNGNYSLSNVPESAIVQFSFVGMKGQEVAVAGKTSINVTLAEDAIGLEEVVAVGYGVQKRSNLTGAVATVNFNQELENRPLTNASQALGGATAGLWVSQNSGQPGNDEATIRVRGYGTLNNANPLILIDGIEGRMSDLNPNDIESFTVLKDAASAAIYGSKAANGVVLITTKMGTTKEKAEVTYNGYFGLQKMGERYDIISNSAEYMEMWNRAMETKGG